MKVLQKIIITIITTVIVTLVAVVILWILGKTFPLSFWISVGFFGGIVSFIMTSVREFLEK